MNTSFHVISESFNVSMCGCTVHVCDIRRLSVREALMKHQCPRDTVVSNVNWQNIQTFRCLLWTNHTKV